MSVSSDTPLEIPSELLLILRCLVLVDLDFSIKKTFVKEIDFPIAFANIASLLLEAFSKWRQVDWTGLFNVYFTVRENQFLKRD